MKLKLSGALICAWLSLWVAAAAGADLPVADSSWKLEGADDGITVHSKVVPNSDLFAFRGETLVDAPVAKVANILIDTSRKLEWVARIVKAKNIREIGPYERNEYNHTSSGFFLVNDRDFVFRAKVDFDREKKRAFFRMRSVEDELMPEQNGIVRGFLHESVYILSSFDEGRKTHVVVEIHVDPKGSVPKWLVNLFQKSWPKRTLDGIRKQAAKPDVYEHLGVRALIGGPAPLPRLTEGAAPAPSGPETRTPERTPKGTLVPHDRTEEKSPRHLPQRSGGP